MQDEYQIELFKKFSENIDFRKEKNVFNHIFGKSYWQIYIYPGKENFNPAKIARSIFKRINLSEKDYLSCTSNLLECLKRAESSKQLSYFKYKSNTSGICFPISQGDRLYGFIVVCNIKKDLNADMLNLFSCYTDTVLKEIQRELELNKLYDTIRPRAIALSTIHTVHRLISSTLELDELIPRIARLSMQVLRARRCSIMLIDSKRKMLMPKANIDVKRRHIRLKKQKIGVGIEGIVATTAKSILKNYIIAVPLIDQDVIGVITVERRLDNRPFSIFDQEILTTLAEQAVVAIRNAQIYEEQEKITIGTIKSLASILDSKIPYAYPHTTSFVDLVLAVAEELELPKEELKHLHYASLLHDAGKITIPDRIFKKPTKLTGKEYGIIKKHPSISVRIIKPLEVLKPALPIIIAHHERYDGTGYPKGLRADKIPIGARIMAVVDAFEAMICKRPYRKAMSFEEAVIEIKQNSGTQFDPKVVDAFLRLVKRGVVRRLLKGCIKHESQ